MVRPMSELPVDDEEVTLRPESVDAVYRRLGRELLGLATLLSGSRQSGEELLHDVFAAAIPRWASIEQPEHYLRRALVNRARSHQRRLVTASRWRPEPDVVTGEPEIDETWRLLSSLPDNQRAAIVLRIKLGLADPEIAGHLDCSEATVRSLVSRGLARLRKELS
jgi:DNA-directed RNA polymerase specialized sigma24 family protein